MRKTKGNYTIENIVKHFLKWYEEDKLSDKQCDHIINDYREYRKRGFKKRIFPVLIKCKKCGFMNTSVNARCFNCLSDMK